MKLAEVSIEKFYVSFEYWEVDAEMADPIVTGKQIGRAHV